MFVWQPDDDNVNDDLGYYWKEIVQFLQSPVRHSLESFILQDDHDIIRVFREALRGPPGRQTARGNTHEPDFWCVRCMQRTLRIIFYVHLCNTVMSSHFLHFSL